MSTPAITTPDTNKDCQKFSLDLHTARKG